LQEKQAQSHKKRAKSHCSFGFLFSKRKSRDLFWL